MLWIADQKLYVLVFWFCEMSVIIGVVCHPMTSFVVLSVARLLSRAVIFLSQNRETSTYSLDLPIKCILKNHNAIFCSGTNRLQSGGIKNPDYDSN